MYTSFLCFAVVASLASAHNVLQLAISKPELSSRQLRDRRLARRGSLTEVLDNQLRSYGANVSVGTPPQQLQLVLDTGSSDIWVISSTASYCQEAADVCPGGTFDAQRSSTLVDVEQDGFNISYADGTGAQGDFVTDVLHIGPAGKQVSINNQQMGVALDTHLDAGVMGIGFAAHESQCDSSSSSSSTPCQTYPTFTRNLVSQGVINSEAYSLWLDDRDANTGSILFGGVDTKKFIGPLVTIPIYPDSETGEYTDFTVAWTGLTLSTPQGPLGGFVPDDFIAGVVLDSGTTVMYLPDDIAASMLAQFDAVPSLDYWFTDCSLRNSTATFDFQFGGPQGPVISVPISELLRPFVDDSGRATNLTDGQAACFVLVGQAGPNTILFGDSFLRSAYVVYDLDNKQISMAQTNFDATGSAIQEIMAGHAVPGASATATVGSVVQAATDLPGAGYPSTAAGAVGLTTRVGSAPLAQYTATNTFNPHPISAAAARQAVPGSSLGFLDGNGAVRMAATAVTLAALGGGILLL